MAFDKDRLREIFGRDFKDDDLACFGARLERQVRGLERVRAWEADLGLIEPATVTHIIRAEKQ